MSRIKIAITLDQQVLSDLDQIITQRVFPNRNRAVEQAVAEKLARLEQAHLIEECTKLDPAFEKALAEEGLAEEASQWPEYLGERFAGPI